MAGLGKLFIIFFGLLISITWAQSQNKKPEKEAVPSPFEYYDENGEPLIIKDVQGREVTFNQDVLATPKEELPDPVKAALLSAAFPGMGQIYNKSYWKVPIVYGSMLTFGYLVHYFDYYYINFRNAFLADNDGNPTTINPYENDIRISSRLYDRIEFYRRNRDYLMILTTAFYLLNVVEAHVDAHLQSFDLSDDISMNIRPGVITTPFSNQFGFTLNINFK